MHKYYDAYGVKTDKIYWDFDFEEMAKYDLPAMLDFITEKTGS
jgi:hypothetical protein